MFIVKRQKSIKLIAGLLVALFPLLSAAGDDQGENGINKGKLKALSGEWWQWSFSIPEAVHPLKFTDPANATLATSEAAKYCGIGQHGDVWFLGGNFDGSAAFRHCAIPADKSILVPIINAECSTIQGDGQTKKALSDCAKGLIDLVTKVEASVDGIALKNAGKTRVQSDLFSFTLPPGDVIGNYGKTPNPSPSVSDGYWLLLPPLRLGVHDIVLHAEVPAYEFIQDIHYKITIVPSSL
jgi:hypothetical protein